MKKLTATMFGTALVILCLFGCGRIRSNDSSTSAPTQDAKWIIATDTVFQPFEYTDEKNQFVGIDVDLLAAIAEDQGFTYELRSLGWDAAVTAVEAGQADAIIAGATINQDRIDNGWIFSDDYYDATQTFVVKKDSKIKKWKDLAGKKVAVKKGTTGADFANSLKDRYGFTVTVFEDSVAMYQDVIHSNAATCVEDTPIISFSIKKDNLDLRIPKGMESDGAPYGMAIMDESNRELLGKILDKYLK